MPRPSLSLHPSQRVSLGDTVTLRCHLPQPAAWVELYQDGKWRSRKEMDQEQDVAEFSLGRAEGPRRVCSDKADCCPLS